MAIIQVDETDFDEVFHSALETYSVVILKFESTYCDGCSALGFELEELDEIYNDVTILEIDAAENEFLTQKYNVTEVPTMIIYKNKEIMYQGVGVMLAVDILNIIKN